MTALTASGSSRLFPDPLGCFRIGSELEAEAGVGGAVAEPQPKIAEWTPGRGPGSRRSPPSFLSSTVGQGRLPFKSQSSSYIKGLARLRVTLEALLKLHVLRDARRLQPKEDKALAVSPSPRS